MEHSRSEADIDPIVTMPKYQLQPLVEGSASLKSACLRRINGPHDGKVEPRFGAATPLIESGGNQLLIAVVKYSAAGSRVVIRDEGAKVEYFLMDDDPAIFRRSDSEGKKSLVSLRDLKSLEKRVTNSREDLRYEKR